MSLLSLSHSLVLPPSSTPLPPTLSCTSCTESSCSSLYAKCRSPVQQSHWVHWAPLLLSPSLSPPALHIQCINSVSPPPQKLLNVRHCVVGFVQISSKQCDDTFWVMWVYFWLIVSTEGLHACVISEHSTQQSVAEGTRLYPGETMRGSVASQAGAVDRLIQYTRVVLTSVIIFVSIAQ